MDKANVDPFLRPKLVDVPVKHKKSISASCRWRKAGRCSCTRIQQISIQWSSKINPGKVEVFRTDFSQSSGNIPPLNLELKPCTTPAQDNIRKYSDSQQIFSRELAGKPFEADLVYPNRPSNGCVHLICHLSRDQQSGVSLSTGATSISSHTHNIFPCRSLKLSWTNLQAPSHFVNPTWPTGTENYS